jgi:uridine kinase
LIEYIENSENAVIAIDGPSGSGKTTFSKNLEEKYDCLVFHTDDYFLHPTLKTTKRLEEPGGNLDYERLEQEILKNLSKEVITSNHFNCMTNELEYKNPVKRKKIVVIEGVYSMHPHFLKYYDYMVFFDIDREKQLQRILARNGEKMLQRFIDEWIPLEDKHFDINKVKQKANLVINFT